MTAIGIDPGALRPDNVHEIAGGLITRTYGPPGTGKTTTLAAELRQLVAARGQHAAAVVAFTTTAAQEIAGRSTGLAPSQVGTLHSLGRKMIGSEQEVALDPKIVAEWNREHGDAWSVTPDGRRGAPETASDAGMTGGASGDTGGDLETGDALLSAMDFYRATLTPRESWRPQVAEFADRWEEWKLANDLQDYGDMINGALLRALEGERPPGDPPFLIVDEAQDLTPAEWALVFALGRTRERLVLAGDDDQAIMEWRGGDAGPLLDLETRSHGPGGALEVTDRVLEQSYRIPSSVHACAAQLAAQLTRRRPKAYRPRDDRGAIRRLPITIGDHRMAKRIARDVDAGRTVMVLAPCTYMLTPLITNLRQEGVPYANAYRPAEARWNPLRPPGEGRWSPALRMLAATSVVDPHEPRGWTGREMRAFTEMMAVGDGGLLRNARARIKLLPDDGEVPWSEIEALFTTGALDGLLGPEPVEGEPEPDPLTIAEQLRYLIDHTTGTWSKRLEYPARVLDRFGPGPLRSRGRLEALDEGGVPVCVGTVHSVKGGGADVVYVCPELSSAGFRQFGRGGAERDQTLRLFYVALTRAKQEVCVLDAASGALFPRQQLVPPALEVQP